MCSNSAGWVLSLCARFSPTVQSNNTADHRTYSQGEICLPNWALSLHYVPAVWVTAPDSRPADSALMRILDQAPHFISGCLLEPIGTKTTGFCCQVSSSQRLCLFSVVSCEGEKAEPCDHSEYSHCVLPPPLHLPCGFYWLIWFFMTAKMFPCLLSCFTLNIMEK